MAKTTRKKVIPAKSQSPLSALGLPLKTWSGQLRRSRGAEARSGSRAFLFMFAVRNEKVLKLTFRAHLNKWQLKTLLLSDSEQQFFQGALGPLWIIFVSSQSTSASSLEKSTLVRARDFAGQLVTPLALAAVDKLIVEFHGLSETEQAAVVTGLEIGRYSFRENRLAGGKPARKLPQLLLKEGSVSEADIRQAADLGLAVNLARHYTNLPAGDLNPRTYSESVQEIFATSKTVKVEVWSGDRLTKERMGLLQAVGGAALEGPRLVHLRYRPTGVSRQPVALVGKGVTFDSGGLDIKPSSGMRWMKKDMGGSASAVALIKWAERTDLQLPLDCYLSLAENAVGSRSFRPGDVLIARNGMSVEISNTDAEGRLVLADALDVAVSQTGVDQPRAVINIATLTGAIKVGLGAEIAGLFSNNDELAEELFTSGLATGDLMWRMPLFQNYRSQIKSGFAEMMNCSEGGFGGAITAALFLESFVGKTPWAHLDIYGWRDSASGAIAESGASGQAVQALAHALTQMAQEK